jgi:hypothetical protein
MQQLVHYTLLVSVQWYGKKIDKNNQTWHHCYVHITWQCKNMGFSITKGIIWVSMWNIGKHKIFSIHGYERTHLKIES